MKKVHPYRHMRPRRVEVLPASALSYSVNRYADDQDIRFGFGRCEESDDEFTEILEIDYAWLGVVFHLLIAKSDTASPFDAFSAAKDNLPAFKALAQKVIIKSLVESPARLPHILETIHEASREQGHLEVIKNTMSAMNVRLDFSEPG